MDSDSEQKKIKKEKLKSTKGDLSSIVNETPASTLPEIRKVDSSVAKGSEPLGLTTSISRKDLSATLSAKENSFNQLSSSNSSNSLKEKSKELIGPAPGSPKARTIEKPKEFKEKDDRKKDEKEKKEKKEKKDRPADDKKGIEKAKDRHSPRELSRERTNTPTSLSMTPPKSATFADFRSSSTPPTPNKELGGSKMLKIQEEEVVPIPSPLSSSLTEPMPPLTQSASYKNSQPVTIKKNKSRSAEEVPLMPLSRSPTDGDPDDASVPLHAVISQNSSLENNEGEGSLEASDEDINSAAQTKESAANLSAKVRLKLEKERIKQEEERLRREEENLSKKAKEEKKQSKELIKKEKERLKREKEEVLKKGRREVKREMQKQRRMSYDRFRTDDNQDDVITGWMKMRGPLKNWYLRYFVLRPGKLIYYRDDVDTDCQGIILLRGCIIIDRETKKEGYCFKILHPLEHNIYSSKGLKGEKLPGALVPLSMGYCILRVSTEDERSRWTKAIKFCIDTSDRQWKEEKEDERDERDAMAFEDGKMDDHDHDPDDTLNISNEESVAANMALARRRREQPAETTYVEQSNLKTGMLDVDRTEEVLGQESKNLVFMLLKQVKIGMDLSKVVLPTFILEPRSMLEKLSDFLSHADLLALVPKINDPLERMVAIVKWYLSGFYIRPEGVKKPYNPIIGELFRCMWKHPNDSKTFFVAEQVSHHPPISAFYASNRKEGYVMNGSILFRSKFLGTSAGSILDGFCTLYLLPFDEEYEITFPSAYAKGFLFGTLLMELAGSVTIICKNTGLRADIEFKQKPMFGGEYNVVTAKIKRERETLFTISGKWDGEINIKNTKTEEIELLWQPTAENVSRRLPIYKPAREEMLPNESEKLWEKVSQAIVTQDQNKATQEKFVLEQGQRQAAKIRDAQRIDWNPRLFVKDSAGVWTYKFFNKDVWNEADEVEEFEKSGIIRSRGGDVSSEEISDDDEETEPIVQSASADQPLRLGVSPDENMQNIRSSVKSPADIQTSDAWKRSVEEKLYQIEKDMLQLKRPLPAERKESSGSRSRLLLGVVLLLFLYILALRSRIAELEEWRSNPGRADL
eukprot:TRINITY_DN2071_c0_g1_i2.p1 TRINITY_DN2071_c0_g1~~TRINITY_DN2071_c0_g1_i2.p1  ORF type:complete len:1089 (+),score=358.13 TRINITY_DN2071_c0_g1_i2:115-3381(+)